MRPRLYELVALGLAGAFIARRGYYFSNPATLTNNFLSQAEWGLLVFR